MRMYTGNSIIFYQELISSKEYGRDISRGILRITKVL
jgi:hypothetical protein